MSDPRTDREHLLAARNEVAKLLASEHGSEEEPIAAAKALIQSYLWEIEAKERKRRSAP